jgi:hypothetical protein
MLFAVGLLARCFEAIMEKCRTICIPVVAMALKLLRNWQFRGAGESNADNPKYENGSHYPIGIRYLPDF